eukprot:9485801-Pyramimonas_sp.AAC.2
MLPPAGQLFERCGGRHPHSRMHLIRLLKTRCLGNLGPSAHRAHPFWRRTFREALPGTCCAHLSERLDECRPIPECIY